MSRQSSLVHQECDARRACMQFSCSCLQLRPRPPPHHTCWMLHQHCTRTVMLDSARHSQQAVLAATAINPPVQAALRLPGHQGLGATTAGIAAAAAAGCHRKPCRRNMRCTSCAQHAQHSGSHSGSHSECRHTHVSSSDAAQAKLYSAAHCSTALALSQSCSWRQLALQHCKQHTHNRRHVDCMLHSPQLSR
jgi:hypothetical protein